MVDNEGNHDLQLTLCFDAIASVLARIEQQFKGKSDLEAYLKWEQKVELLFQYHNYSEIKKASIAMETLQVFAPLTKFLEMYQIKLELENISFMYTNAEDYTKVKRRVADLYKEHEKELMEERVIEEFEGGGAAPSFPPPLSSLNQKGQASFALIPVRENGRLQLNKVRIKRPEILYASREHGRLKMFLVPDQCDDDLEDEEEEEEPQQEFKVEEEEDESTSLVSEEEEEEEEEEVRVIVGDWKFNNNKIEGFMRCHHQLVNQSQNNNPHNHHHHNLNMYGVISIA
nr:uncharacterized protein LOC112742786 [Arachis hypogaea]